MSLVFACTILGQPATKKNSSRAFRGRVLPSKAFSRYESRFHRQLMELRKKCGELPHFACPVGVTALYYLENAAHYPDLVGLLQATADIISDEYKTVEHRRVLKKEWLLADDRIIKSWNGSRIVGIDRARPRVELVVYQLPWADDEPDPYLRRLRQTGLALKPPQNRAQQLSQHDIYLLSHQVDKWHTGEIWRPNELFRKENP